MPLSSEWLVLRKRPKRRTQLRAIVHRLIILGHDLYRRSSQFRNVVGVLLRDYGCTRNFMRGAVLVVCGFLFPEEAEPENEDGDADEADGADGYAGYSAAG
jgi:hypothetical protein